MDDVVTIHDLMRSLRSADLATVRRMAGVHGPLAVRLAMLGLAAEKKVESPLWWGYPPGVFVGYKWDANPVRGLATRIASHVRGLGYRAYVDVEALDEDADPYVEVPTFITSLHECSFYVLLLTELAADMLGARHKKTTWVFDEYQHAVRLTNAGRLFIVPVLVEPGGMSAPFTPDGVIDLTTDPTGLSALDDILTPGPLSLPQEQVGRLATACAEFDHRFLRERWDEAQSTLTDSADLQLAFDHQFRQFLLALYTADEQRLAAATTSLHATYGSQILHHIYRGYCEKHGIPNRSVVG